MHTLCFEWGVYYSFKPLSRGRCISVEAGRVRGMGGSWGPGVEVVDGYAVPGFVDAHLHLEGLVLAGRGVDVSGAASPEDVYRAVEGGGGGTGIVYARGAPAWVVESVDPEALEGAAAAPVILVSCCGHVAVAGPAAARLAGVNPGIHRGEGVGALVDAVLSTLGCSEALEALRGLLRLGVTAAGLMDSGSWAASCLSSLLGREGRLPVRCSLFLSRRHARRLVDVEGFMPRGAWLRVTGLKLYADGSFSACSAAVSTGYAGCRGVGVEAADPAELRRWVEWGLGRGLMVAVHAIGDVGVEAALDALEPCPPWSCRVEHCSLSTPRQWRVMARRGVWAVVQPGFPVHDAAWLPERLGARAGECYRWRGMLEAGVRLAFGSDAPVEPADPLWGLDAVASGAPPLYPGPLLPPREALHAYTAAAAEAAGYRWAGRLLPGYYADAAVIACDPLEEWGGLRRCGLTAVLSGGELLSLR